MKLCTTEKLARMTFFTDLSMWTHIWMTMTLVSRQSAQTALLAVLSVSAGNMRRRDVSLSTALATELSVA